MTKAGLLEKQFALYKKEVEARFSALENAIAELSTKKQTSTTRPVLNKKAEEKASEIVIEAKDDIVAQDAE